MNAPVVERPQICSETEARADEFAADKAIASLPRRGRVVGAARGAVYDALREIEDTDGYVLGAEMSAAKRELKVALAAQDSEERQKEFQKHEVAAEPHSRHRVVSRDELPDPFMRTREIFEERAERREERHEARTERKETREEELERFLSRMQQGPFRMRQVVIHGASETVAINDGIFEVASKGVEIDNSDPRSDGVRIHANTRIRGELRVVSGRMVNTDPEAAPGSVSLRGVTLSISGIPEFDEENPHENLRAA